MWTGLTRILDNPRIPLDNNAAERAERGPVIGRKNHYGSRSRRGTEVAAIFYSLVESAKLAGVEPKTYLHLAASAALTGQSIPLPHELRG
jgi:transposase